MSCHKLLTHLCTVHNTAKALEFQQAACLVPDGFGIENYSTRRTKPRIQVGVIAFQFSFGGLNVSISVRRRPHVAKFIAQITIAGEVETKLQTRNCSHQSLSNGHILFFLLTGDNAV